jgi:hypothetical protein
MTETVERIFGLDRGEIPRKVWEWDLFCNFHNEEKFMLCQLVQGHSIDYFVETEFGPLRLTPKNMFFPPKTLLEKAKKNQLLTEFENTLIIGKRKKNLDNDDHNNKK